MPILRAFITFGTRPEAIKMAPIIDECRRRASQIEAIVCLTGQHHELLSQVRRQEAGSSSSACGGLAAQAESERYSARRDAGYGTAECACYWTNYVTRSVTATVRAEAERAERTDVVDIGLRQFFRDRYPGLTHLGY